MREVPALVVQRKTGPRWRRLRVNSWFSEFRGAVRSSLTPWSVSRRCRLFPLNHPWPRPAAGLCFEDACGLVLSQCLRSTGPNGFQKPHVSASPAQKGGRWEQPVASEPQFRGGKMKAEAPPTPGTMCGPSPGALGPEVLLPGRIWKPLGQRRGRGLLLLRPAPSAVFVTPADPREVPASAGLAPGLGGG